MDVDTGGARGDSGGGIGANNDCAASGGGGTTRDDFAACDSGVYVAKYGTFVSEVEEVVYTDVGVLSDVFAIIWGVVAGGICDYHECEGRILADTGGGGAGIAAILLVVIDEDEWDVPREYQCEDTGGGGKASGEEPNVCGVATSGSEDEAFGVEASVYTIAGVDAIYGEQANCA